MSRVPSCPPARLAVEYAGLLLEGEPEPAPAALLQQRPQAAPDDVSLAHAELDRESLEEPEISLRESE